MKTMTVVNLSSRSGGGGASGDFKLLETDVYRMKIVAATLEEDQYAEPLNDGTKPVRLVLRWEVSAAGEDQDDDVKGCAVWQRFAPWYGTVRDGGPSKFKAFIDSLREQSYLASFDPSAFNLEDLVSIEQRVSVEKYAKTMGPNAGKPGNKVVGILPLKRAKNGKASVIAPPPGELVEEDLPL
jgi:hypothetical protein